MENTMKKILLSLFLLLSSVTSYALQPLPADEAFALSAQKDQQGLSLHWKIAPGYYLYREQFSFVPSAQVNLPAGIPKEDEILGKYQVYENEVTLSVPITKPASGSVDLIVHYQGCAASGFCYPPITKKLHLQADGIVTLTDANSMLAPTVPDTTVAAPESSQDQATQLLASQHWFLILLGFFGFGLLLAFTPCVLPLLPILSGIIVGQGSNLTTRKAFLLSLTYVLAMAVAYAGAGVLAGLAGSYVQAFLQSPWVLSIFSLIFVLLALSLFGFYELQLPAVWQEKLTNYSNRQSGGTYVGVAIMGALSTLIVSPCVTAPLIGALSYIGKTGDAVLGGMALFAMGLGFGVPLLIVGTMGGKLLPKAGGWMDIIKAIFGVMMLAIAVWLLSRVIPAQITMFLWSALVIISAVYMGAFSTTPINALGKLWKGISLIIFVYGLLLLIGAAIGNTNPLQPLNFQSIANTTSTQAALFKSVNSLQDLERELVDAKAQHKPVMLDFYADWCIACKEMERNTFSNPQVQAALSGYVLLRADVTKNDQADQALEKQFNVVAPPSMIFFDANGQELVSKRIVGEMDAQTFLQHLPK